MAAPLAGTIGARNQGTGIVGVAPGIGIYALRVLHADGNGLLSDLLRAYDHLVANARQLGIRVVNLSLSGDGRSTDEDCRYVTELAQQGITVVTAAGALQQQVESMRRIMQVECKSAHRVAAVAAAAVACARAPLHLPILHTMKISCLVLLCLLTASKLKKQPLGMRQGLCLV
jgi:hypothetical protein